MRLTPWYEEITINVPGNGLPYELEIIIVTMKTGYSLSINSENKQASFLNVSNGEEHSAYDSIDHSYNSFIYIDQGLYKLKEPQGVQMKITYKKWVAD